MSVEFTVLGGGVVGDVEGSEEDPPSGPSSRLVGSQIALRLVHGGAPATVIPDLVGPVSPDIAKLLATDFVGGPKSLFLQSINTLLQRTCSFFVVMERYAHACAVLERELACCRTTISEELAALENARTRRILGVVMPFKARASGENLAKCDHLTQALGVVVEFQEACSQPIRGHADNHAMRNLAVSLNGIGSAGTAQALVVWRDCLQAFQAAYRLVDDALAVCKCHQENNLLARSEPESGGERANGSASTKKDPIKPLVQRWEDGSATLRDFTHFWHSAFFHSEVIAAVPFRAQILTVFENSSDGNMPNADLLKLWSFGSNGTDLQDRLH